MVLNVPNRGGILYADKHNMLTNTRMVVCLQAEASAKEAHQRRQRLETQVHQLKVWEGEGTEEGDGGGARLSLQCGVFRVGEA